MAVSGRIYIGVLVFSLIAALTVVPTTIMIVSGYEPPSVLPLQDPDGYSLGDKLAFSIASLITIVLVVASWRMLINGARQRQGLKVARQERASSVELGGDGGPARPAPARKAPKGREDEEAPPGYM